jgi:hypothetical protein
MFLVYIIINFLILSLIFIYYFKKITDFSMYTVKKLDTSKINSGDTLIVSYNHKTKYAVFNSFIKSKFVHPSIAVRENGKLYLIEYNEYFDKYKGLIKIPYEEWIKFNKNAKIYINHFQNNKSKELDKKIINWYRENLEDITKKINYMDYSWFRFINPLNKKYKNTKNNPNITCCEIICEILCETGIVKKNKSIQHYRPDSFVDMKDFSLEEDYNISESYLLDI